MASINNDDSRNDNNNQHQSKHRQQHRNDLPPLLNSRHQSLPPPSSSSSTRSSSFGSTITANGNASGSANANGSGSGACNENENNINHQFLYPNANLSMNNSTYANTNDASMTILPSLSASLTPVALGDDLDRLRLTGRSHSTTSVNNNPASTSSMNINMNMNTSMNMSMMDAFSSPTSNSMNMNMSTSSNANAMGGLSLGLSNSFASMTMNMSDHPPHHMNIGTSYSFSSITTAATNNNGNINTNINSNGNNVTPTANSAIPSNSNHEMNLSMNMSMSMNHQDTIDSNTNIEHPQQKQLPNNNILNNNNNNNANNRNAITSIIHDAARITDWTSVNNLAQSHPASAAYKCPDGLTPIHHACSRRCPYPSVFHNLIKANPDALTEIDEKGWTPLHYACRFKAPMEGVRLLLHLYKEKGCSAARSRCRENGRTPLFYAIRYDAPEGVVELLLNCMSKPDVLDGDREGVSVLRLVWDKYVNSMEGKRIVSYYSKILRGWESKNTPWEERIEKSRKLREEMRGKLKVCWKKANLLLRGAFKFSLQDNDDDDDNNYDNNYESGVDDNNNDTNDDNNNNGKGESNRKWRILHAAASIRCHSSLVMMACVLHPEQSREIDDQDLYGPKSISNDQQINNDQFTALHLAAKSPMRGKDSQLVILSLLEMYPEAAALPNPADNSLPLHYLCENTFKTHWVKDILPVYNAHPQAALAQDCNGRTPLHRATTICESRNVPPPPLSTPTSSTASTLLRTALEDPAGSIIQNILALHGEVASIVDIYGKLPFHSIAELGETWDANVQCLYDAHPAALSTRTNRESGNNLPIHLVASNPDAKACLISKIVEFNPRGASLMNREGKLPLHLTCESGKSFDGGWECIYNAFPNAIRIAEDNERRWMPLHFMITCPNSSIELIERVMSLNPEAAHQLDGENKTTLHLAIESGKDWGGGIEKLFDAYPSAIQVEDNLGRIPLVAALFSYCDGNNSNTPTEDTHPQQADEIDSTSTGESQSSTIDNKSHIESSETDDDALIGPHLAQVNVLYHLLKAAPYVLDTA